MRVWLLPGRQMGFWFAFHDGSIERSRPQWRRLGKRVRLQASCGALRSGLRPALVVGDDRQEGFAGRLVALGSPGAIGGAGDIRYGKGAGTVRVRTAAQVGSLKLNFLGATI